MTRPRRLHRHQCMGADCAYDAMGYPLCWLDDDITRDVEERKTAARKRVGGVPQQIQISEAYPELPDGMVVSDRHYHTWRRHGPFWYRTKGSAQPLSWPRLIATRGPLRGRIIVPLSEAA